jgi:hypothetical protein
MCNPDVGEFLVDRFHDKIVRGCSEIRMRNTMLYDHFSDDNMMLWDHSVVNIIYNVEIIFFDIQIKKEMISGPLNNLINLSWVMCSISHET